MLLKVNELCTLVLLENMNIEFCFMLSPQSTNKIADIQLPPQLRMFKKALIYSNRSTGKSNRSTRLIACEHQLRSNPEQLDTIVTDPIAEQSTYTSPTYTSNWSR